MSGSEREERFERIIVACDASPLGAAALEAAAVLAESLQAELAGLFVEDVNLLRMAALPFTRELGLASALLRPIEPTDIEREFRRHAELTRKALEDAALASSVRWSFQVVRGEPLAALLLAAERAGLLVVGAPWGQVLPFASVRQKARPDPKARRGERAVPAQPVAVLYDGSRQAGRVLDLGRSLATRAGSALAILIVAETEKEYRASCEQAQARLKGHKGAVRLVWLRGRDLRALAQAAAAQDPAALLCADPLDSERVAALLAAVRCPVVLVR